MIARGLALLCLSACGRLEFAPIGDGAFPDIIVQPGCRARSVGVGDNHTCVAVENGNVYCTGTNTYGALGFGEVTTPIDTPVLASRLMGSASIHAGNVFTSVTDASGAVRCVGNNANSQCGTSGPMHLEPVAPVGLPPVSHLATGYSFSCALAQSGDTYCWGDADEGQGGNNTATTSDHEPEIVPALVGLNAVPATGATHACALLPGGGVRCWGDGRVMRLGVTPPDTCPNASAGSIACALQPIAVPVPAMKAIAGGEEHTCALTLAGEPWCWGANDDLQVGLPPSPEESPARVGDLVNAQDIVTARNHTCVLGADGRVSCWGDNGAKQLGATGPDSATPVVVALPEAVTSVHAGVTSYHTCAILEGGSVWCWGGATMGQLGRGPQTEPGLPGPMLLPCP